MTKINFAGSNKKGTLRIVGHAGFAKAGNDIVCAGISTLANALLMSLEEENRYKGINLEYTLKDGLVNASWDMTPQNKAWSKMFMLGIESLSETYPEHVRIEWI